MTKTFTRKVEFCHDTKFNGIDCLEKENQYGFFKSEIDIRPSSCFWIDKKIVKKLGDIFKEKFREMIGVASLNQSVTDRKQLLSLLEGVEEKKHGDR